MNINHLNVGIMHSLVGKNDGVSIVIDQTVNALVDYFSVGLGNIFFLAAHTSPRFNAITDDVFWHKSQTHKIIIENYSKEAKIDLNELDELIHTQALYAKEIIKEWVNKNQIDLIMAHNTSHPYNFITAVGLGYYFEELIEQGIIWPKLLVWWHDSYWERPIFKNPNRIIKKYLKYLPGTYVDGIVFINKTQIKMGKEVFTNFNNRKMESFFRNRAIIIPNTSKIHWDWESYNWRGHSAIYPPQDNYNDDFFEDIGLLDAIKKEGFTLDDTVILLQHTRIVPRKKIEVALDFAYEIEKRYKKDGVNKCVALVVSGHSGDEGVSYKRMLFQHYHNKKVNNPDSRVILIFGEGVILSHRDIIVDKKYYKFSEIPDVIAAHNGLATYFSEIEGFGNNLLEVLSAGLPAAINKYEVYKTDIECLGFKLPTIDECRLNEKVIEESYKILTNQEYRNEINKHNLETLYRQLGHQIIAEKLRPLIINMFTQIVK
ncbi:MAG: hypothetical protein U9R32_04860 [Bacteroidota bacterium]|nr:hypothetical protein [Bacteroidota bacterium]